MNNCHCNPLSCSRTSSGTNLWHRCGCSTGDPAPACNPHAPWHRHDCTCMHCSASVGCGFTPCHDSCSACGSWQQYSPGASGYLIPHYVSIGRTFQRQITQTLCVEGIPDCAESPLTLVGVTVCGQASWEQVSECRQQLLRVTVPVAVQIRDCAGFCRTGHASVTLTIPLCGCSHHDFWRGQLYVAPCIRLAAPVTENEDGCFDAPLEISAEVYLVRLSAAPISGSSTC